MASFQQDAACDGNLLPTKASQTLLILTTLAAYAHVAFMALVSASSPLFLLAASQFYNYCHVKAEGALANWFQDKDNQSFAMACAAEFIATLAYFYKPSLTVFTLLAMALVKQLMEKKKHLLTRTNDYETWYAPIEAEGEGDGHVSAALDPFP
ncbi:hypothetical protein ACEQ8H_007392 [Pleosporales sp. CAS-2024a]